MKRLLRARTAGKAFCCPSVLPREFLDDYVGEDNPVRAIDVFVDGLDLRGLGFEGVVAETTGRPAYHPATMLKIYVYGYIQQIQSNERLERGNGAQRRDDVADSPVDAGFQDDRGFSQGQRPGDPLCLLAIRRAVSKPEPLRPRDGGDRRKPVQGRFNSRDQIEFSRGSLGRRMEQVEASIERWLGAGDGGSSGRRVGASQVGAAEGQDRLAARADA